MVQLLSPGPHAVGMVVMEDGVMHERGVGGGEGGLPVQGFPLGLSLGCRFLLQLCQAPLLLLDHLLTCTPGRRREAGQRAGVSQQALLPEPTGAQKPLRWSTALRAPFWGCP